MSIQDEFTLDFARTERIGLEEAVFAAGKSILNRSSKTNIGALMLEYGGGGHENAGTCQVDNELAEDVLGALVKRITSEG